MSQLRKMPEGHISATPSFRAIRPLARAFDGRSTGVPRPQSADEPEHRTAVQAKAGADEKKLLQILGLAPDSRNKKSVQRYIKLAAPPVAGVVS